MDQVLRFLGFLVIGIAAGLEFVGFTAVLIIEGPEALAQVFTEPVSLAVMVGAYLPGIGLYLIGRWIREPEAARPSAAASKDDPAAAPDPTGNPKP